MGAERRLRGRSPAPPCAGAVRGTVRHDLPADLSAAALARLAAEQLARARSCLPPRPLYLRRPDAQVPANYKVVTPT